MAYLELKNASKAYGKDIILIDQELIIDKPGMYFIVGPSGCGKSTLLSILANIQELSSGSFEKIGHSTVIFQNYELINELSILENIFFQKEKDMSSAQRALLKQLGIDVFKDRKVKHLSFGQRQRIGIARALAQDPDIVLCDEPTESLDKDNKTIVMQALKAYSQDRIVIIVSHDLSLIEKYYDVIYSFSDKRFIKVADRSSERKAFSKDKRPRTDLIHTCLKMTRKGSILLLVVLPIFILAIFFLYSFKEELFDIPKSTRALNAEYVYISTPTDLDTIRENFAYNAEAILPFEYMKNDKEKIRADIFPLHYQDGYEINGSLPSGAQVVINQLDTNYKIGDVITLEVGKIDIDVTISGVIYEPDALSFVIYYDLESLIAELGSYGEMLIEHPEAFEAQVRYDRIPVLLENQIVYAPFYELRAIMIADVDRYQMIFDGLLIVLMILGVVVSTILVNKDLKTFRYQSFILSSMAIDANTVKKLFLLERAIEFLVAMIMSYIICLLLNEHLFVLEDGSLAILALILLTANLIYIVSMILSLRIK